MMKFILAFVLAAFSVEAADNIIKLPEPDLTGGVPLMDAIAQRKTMREYSAKKVEEQDLSNILFAAWGISHDGKRTIPTARNEQNLDVFAVMNGKVWHYDATGNTLSEVSSENLLPALAKQDFVKDAPLHLIFTGKPDDKGYTAMNAGAAYQNVGLYCASRGLNNVVRGFIDHEAIAKVLNMKPEEILVTQTIGWPNM